MRNILAFIFRLMLVGPYYIIVCPLVYIILLLIHPFKINKNVNFKNVFDSNFIDTDPYEISMLETGDKYYSYESAWNWLIDKKLWYTK